MLIRLRLWVDDSTPGKFFGIGTEMIFISSTSPENFSIRSQTATKTVACPELVEGVSGACPPKPWQFIPTEGGRRMVNLYLINPVNPVYSVKIIPSYLHLLFLLFK
jgi:hypothetical protein